MNFGIKLQLLRKDKRMSQEALAQQLDVSRQAVSKWETGEGYPEIDKLIMISNLFGVTLDYLMKEDSNEDTIRAMDEDAIILSTSELEDLIRFKERFAFTIAISVAAIISAVSLGAFFEDNNLMIGLMFLIIGVAVGCIIITGILSGKYEYLDKKSICLKPSDLDKVKEDYRKFKTTFAILIAFGVFCCIAATAMVAAFEEAYPAVSGYFFIIIAFAVFNFIRVGVKDDMYKKLCNNKEHIKEVKKEEEENKYYAVTMPLAAMVYLLLGFLFNAWHPGWLVFPITALVTTAYITLKR